MSIHAKNELNPLAIPAIQFAAQRKSGVPAQCDLRGMLDGPLNGSIDPGAQPSWLTALPGRLTR